MYFNSDLQNNIFNIIWKYIIDKNYYINFNNIINISLIYKHKQNEYYHFICNKLINFIKLYIN